MDRAKALEMLGKSGELADAQSVFTELKQGWRSWSKQL